jgi:hypothetical protein
VKKILVGLLAVLCTLPVGAQEHVDPSITKLQRVGPIRTGMNAADLIKLLGPAKLKSKPAIWEATGMMMMDWRYPDKGLTVSLGRRAVEREGELNVEDFTVSAPSAWKTPQGIGLGSTAEQVRKSYAGKIDKGSGSQQIVVGSVYGGLIFRLKNGKVYEIFVGSAAE